MNNPELYKRIINVLSNNEEYEKRQYNKKYQELNLKETLSELSNDSSIRIVLTDLCEALESLNNSALENNPVRFIKGLKKTIRTQGGKELCY